MDIRKLTLADKAAFERFEAAMLEDKKTNPFVEWWPTENFETFVGQSDLSEVFQEGQTWSPFTRYFGFIDGEIAGFVICFWDLGHPDCLNLGHLGYMVAPAFRQKGIATELVAFGLERYRERGVSSLYIAMDEDNLASRKTAERAGGRLLGLFEIEHNGEQLTSAKYEVTL